MDPSVGGVEGDGEEELPLVFKEWRYKHNTPSKDAAVRDPDSESEWAARIQR